MVSGRNSAASKYKKRSLHQCNVWIFILFIACDVSAYISIQAAEMEAAEDALESRKSLHERVVLVDTIVYAQWLHFLTVLSGHWRHKCWQSSLIQQHLEWLRIFLI